MEAASENCEDILENLKNSEVLTWFIDKFYRQKRREVYLQTIYYLVLKIINKRHFSSVITVEESNVMFTVYWLQFFDYSRTKGSLYNYLSHWLQFLHQNIILYNLFQRKLLKGNHLKYESSNCLIGRYLFHKWKSFFPLFLIVYITAMKFPIVFKSI